MMDPILTASELSYSYPDSNHPVLDGFSFDLHEGEFAALLGPGGAGKSTIFRLLSGFLEPQSGSVRLFGENVRRMPGHERARKLAMVPQECFAPLPYTVREVVAMGRCSRLSRFGGASAEDYQKVDECLELMKVSCYSSRQFNHLSGGEKQRVMIAAALAQDPKIMLLDEPTAALDIGHCARLMRLLTRMNKERKIAIMLISHDIQLASRFCERLLLLHNGRLEADGPPPTVLKPELIDTVYETTVSISTDKNGKFLVAPE